MRICRACYSNTSYHAKGGNDWSGGWCYRLEIDRVSIGRERSSLTVAVNAAGEGQFRGGWFATDVIERATHVEYRPPPASKDHRERSSVDAIGTTSGEAVKNALFADLPET